MSDLIPPSGVSGCIQVDTVLVLHGVRSVSPPRIGQYPRKHGRTICLGLAITTSPTVCVVGPSS